MISPLISILMTAYNRQQFIAEAIESVLAATFQDIELIIVDDCSNDDTVAIAKGYAASDSRIRLYLNEKNLGDYPNRNKAVGYAQGKYIIWCDSDDKMLINTIEKTIGLITSFPDTLFGITFEGENKEAFLLDSNSVIRKHFFEKPLLMKGPGGTIINTSFFKKIGGYPEKYGPANDMYFNLKAAGRSSVLMIPFEFIYYRRHEGQEINNKESYLYNAYLYLNDALNELDLPLSKEQLKYLHNKNKRRFVTNLVRFFCKTLSYSKTRMAIRRTNFRIKDFIAAIFQ